MKTLPKEILQRSVYSSSSYVNFLLSQLRRDWVIEPEKDFAYQQDQEIYEKLRLDARYRAVEETLLAEVAGTDWSLSTISGQKETIPFYNWIVNKISAFAESRINLARAVIEGMSVLKIQGAFIYEKAPTDSKKRRWWVPTKLIFIARERLRRSIHIDSKGRKWWRWNLFDPYLNKWLPIIDESRFIWSFYRATEENLGYGEGLAKSLYYLMKLKVVLQELLAAGAERWVDSWIIVKLEDTLKTTDNLYNDEELNTLLDSIAKMRSNGVLALQNADIQMMNGSQGTTSQTILDMIEKIDREITILMTSTNLPTDIQGGGSYAATQGQLEQQNKRLTFQRQSVVAEPLSDWLIYSIWKNNLPNWKDLGLQDHEVPYFTISGGEIYDVSERLQVFQFALENGIPITEEDLRSQLKLTTPAKDEKVIQKQQQPTQPGGFSAVERAPSIFAQAAVLKDLPKKDKREEAPRALEKPLEKLGETLIKLSFGDMDFNELKEKEEDLIDTLQKMLLYHELRGREDAIKDIAKEVKKLKIEGKGQEIGNGERTL